jgi:hypothetical protein
MRGVLITAAVVFVIAAAVGLWWWLERNRKSFDDAARWQAFSRPSGESGWVIGVEKRLYRQTLTRTLYSWISSTPTEETVIEAFGAALLRAIDLNEREQQEWEI